MSNMFDFFFDGLENFHLQASGQQQPAASSKAPPASFKVLQSLPMVKITADDLLEQTNKECIVCLEEQTLGNFACKLPCGHIYHRNCIKEWLEKNCSCPVCRYELETDDACFEQERKKRMKERKLRLRVDEIKAKSISQLRQLCVSLNINVSDCIDKNEVVQKIVNSGKVIIVEGLPPVHMTSAEFQSHSVAQLKHLLLSFGLQAGGALEKSELRNIILNSGRIVIEDNDGRSPSDLQDKPNAVEAGPGSDHHDNSVNNRSGSQYQVRKSNDDNPNIHSSLSSPASTSAERSLTSDVATGDRYETATSTEAPSTYTQGTSSAYTSEGSRAIGDKTRSEEDNSTLFTLSRSLLSEFSIRELKSIMQSYNIDGTGCLERADIISRIENCSDIQISP